MHHKHYDSIDEAGSTGLGLASIGVGLTEIAAPRQVEKLMGIESGGENTGVLRVLGVREIMHGFDLLTHKDPTPGVFARVAGDLLDGVLLGVAGMKSKRPGGFLAACAMVLPIVALDMFFAQRQARE